MDNHEHERHNEKLISLDLKNYEKNQVADVADRIANVAINSEAPPVWE